MAVTTRALWKTPVPLPTASLHPAISRRHGLQSTPEESGQAYVNPGNLPVAGLDVQK